MGPMQMPMKPGVSAVLPLQPFHSPPLSAQNVVPAAFAPIVRPISHTPPMIERPVSPQRSTHAIPARSGSPRTLGSPKHLSRLLPSPGVLGLPPVRESENVGQSRLLPSPGVLGLMPARSVSPRALGSPKPLSRLLPSPGALSLPLNAPFAARAPSPPRAPSPSVGTSPCHNDSHRTLGSRPLPMAGVVCAAEAVERVGAMERSRVSRMVSSP